MDNESERDSEFQQALAGQHSRGDHRGENRDHVEAAKVIVRDAALELRFVLTRRIVASLRHAHYL